MKWTRLVWILNICVLIAVGFAVAGVFRKSEGVAPVDAASPRHEDVTAAPASPPLTEQDRLDMVSRNIFLPDGSSGRDSARSGPTSALARTKLQLRLLGTVAGDDEIARAVIEDTLTKAQDIYRIGDSVQGAEVQQIARNRVILLVDGENEVLELYLTAAGPSSSAAAKNPGPAIDLDLTKAVSIISPTQFEINKKALLAQIGGVEAVIKAARLTPHVVDGKTQGLRITGLDNISMARFVGIQNDDVIELVNGQRLTSRQKAYQVMRKARAQASLDVQLMREGEEKKLSFSMK